jgi:hypothetical protein
MPLIHVSPRTRPLESEQDERMNLEGFLVFSKVDRYLWISVLVDFFLESKSFGIDATVERNSAAIDVTIAPSIIADRARDFDEDDLCGRLALSHSVSFQGKDAFWRDEPGGWLQHLPGSHYYMQSGRANQVELPFVRRTRQLRGR